MTISPLFCCPVSYAPLQMDEDRTKLTCSDSGRTYPIEDEIPDLFIEEDEASAIREDDTNRKWLLEEVAASREEIFEECTRCLKGVHFLMETMARWSHPGLNVLGRCKCRRG